VKIEITNLTRSTFVFPVFLPSEKKGGPMIQDHENDIVVGDRNNTDELYETYGVTPSRRCPPCTVVVDQSVIDGLQPSVRKAFDALVTGDPVRKIKPSLRVQSVAA
jgi:hypothetical protein